MTPADRLEAAYVVLFPVVLPCVLDAGDALTRRLRARRAPRPLVVTR